MRIISGGQTGVDRGALDAALDVGSECGGWCPADRLAEDGEIPPRLPLRPAPKPGYRERTQRNVLDSDGTWLIYYGSFSGGTEETLLVCLHLRRPYLLTDAREIMAARAGAVAAEFVRARGLRTLNVAGPRASRWPDGAAYARAAVAGLLALVGQDVEPLYGHRSQERGG